MSAPQRTQSFAAKGAYNAVWYERNVQRQRAYNAEYCKRKSHHLEGQNTLMQAWEKARAPSDSAVLPPRFCLQGVASASPDFTESQVEDTEAPWELHACTSTDQDDVQIAERF